MRSAKARWFGGLEDRVDAASVGLFRILAGGAVLVQILFAWKEHAADFVTPGVAFPYLPFPVPVTGAWVHVLFGLMAASAAGMTLGFFYRVSTALFLASFSYFFFMDKQAYSNYSYLILLVSFLFLFTGADRWASVDRLRGRASGSSIPLWNLLLLRFQVAAVYFFSGLSKLNEDWLGGEPLRHTLPHRAIPLFGPLPREEWVVYFFSYTGLLFDLAIGFLLFFRRTRLIGIIGVLLFNVINLGLFRLGTLPYFLMAACVLFAEPDGPRRLWGRLTGSPSAEDLAPAPTPRRRATVAAFVVAYSLLQILIPLRHWFYPGNVDWTEEGHRFSWRMMVRNKLSKMRIMVTDPRTSETRTVDPLEDLTRSQRGKVAQHPDMLIQYVHHLRRRLEASGMRDPIIRAEVSVSLNFRPPQNLIDPDVNLAEVRYPVFSHAPWILPLEAGHRGE